MKTSFLLKRSALLTRYPLSGLLLFSTFAVLALLASRIYLSHSIAYIFLSWNLFLAWIPMGFAYLLRRSVDKKNGKWLRPFYLLSWLLFFPNAPYILTDLFHLKAHPGIPLWFDLILLLWFAWNGLLAGFISLFKVQEFIRIRYGHAAGIIVAFMAICLSSFGVYLGRYERWNSWDIVTQPLSLSSAILEKILHPFSHPTSTGLTFLFSLFLSMVYFTLYLLAAGKRDA